LDSDEADIVFDPLLSKEGINHSKNMEPAKQTNIAPFHGPRDSFSGAPQLNMPLRGAVIPPSSPSAMGLNNPVYFHVRPQTFHPSTASHSPNKTLLNGNTYYVAGGVATVMPQAYHNASQQAGFFPPNSPNPLSAGGALGGPVTPLNNSLGSGSETWAGYSRNVVSPRTLTNNNRTNVDSPTLPPLQPPLNAAERQSTVNVTANSSAQTSYLHGNYQRGTMPAMSVVERRTKMFEEMLSTEGAMRDLRHPKNSSQVVNNSTSWEKFE